MPRTLLLAADNKHSIIAELAGGQPNPIAYSTYGQPSAAQAIATHLAFNGECRERPFGWYFLGNGYRVYNPILMCFHSPDSWSPFGEGGLNAYRYCGGDPVNYSDPTGHVKLLKLLGLSNSPSRTTSTASLSVLIPNASPMASSSPKLTQKTLPGLTRNIEISHETLETRLDLQAGKYQQIHVKTETYTKTRYLTDARGRPDYIDYGPSRSTPPQMPSRKPYIPRVNDNGGLVTGPAGEVWRSTPFEFPSGPPPLPATRTESNGLTHYYSMTYHDNGTTTLRSEQKISLRDIQKNIRT